jgi:hypothetical protein
LITLSIHLKSHLCVSPFFHFALSPHSSGGSRGMVRTAISLRISGCFGPAPARNRGANTTFSFVISVPSAARSSFGANHPACQDGFQGGLADVEPLRDTDARRGLVPFPRGAEILSSALRLRFPGSPGGGVAGQAFELVYALVPGSVASLHRPRHPRLVVRLWGACSPRGFGGLVGGGTGLLGLLAVGLAICPFSDAGTTWVRWSQCFQAR